MNHIDITFDFETCSVAPNAAPMQLAAVVWDRTAPYEAEHPFLSDIDYFNIGIDLRTCVVSGFDFDQNTIDWWERQSSTAKLGVTGNDVWPVDEVFRKFFDWVNDVKKTYNADSVCLWCQGQDFDFPILKTIAKKFNLKMPVHQHYYRDCRTYVLEAAMILAAKSPAKYQTSDGKILTPDAILEKPMRAYEVVPKVNSSLLEGRDQHDALYDCIRSSWSVWMCMKKLEQL